MIGACLDLFDDRIEIGIRAQLHLDEIRAATTKKIIAAGGITSMDEVEKLDALGIDAVVGMAIYTGKMKV